MPEIQLEPGEAFELVERCKGKRCQVKLCSNKKRHGKGLLCGTHTQALWRLRNPVKAAFDTLRTHAKARKLEFGLTLDDFRAIAEATGYVARKGRDPLSLSIDRENARRGYVLDNIKIITRGENTAKGNRERRHVFRGGVRIPWDEVDLFTHEQAETERRKGFVPFLQEQAANVVPLDEWQEPEWLRA